MLRLFICRTISVPIAPVLIGVAPVLIGIAPIPIGKSKIPIGISKIAAEKSKILAGTVFFHLLPTSLPLKSPDSRVSPYPKPITAN